MKILTALILFIAVSWGSFADTEDVRNVDALIRAGLNDNHDAIMEASSSLTHEERLSLYDLHSKTFLTNGAGILNIALPFLLVGNNFGIGNFAQGDRLGGALTLAGNLTGIGLGVWGLVEYSRDASQVSPALFVAIPVILVSTLFGITRNFNYPVMYNGRLRVVLRL